MCLSQLQRRFRPGMGAALAAGVAVSVGASALVDLLFAGGSVAVRTILVATIAAGATTIAGAGVRMAGLARENARLRDEVTRSVGMVQRVDRFASLGLVAAGIAHEVRTPLVALQTFAQLLPTRWEDAEFRREYSEVVLSEIARTGVLINDLLQLARRSATSRAYGGSLESVTTILPVLRAQAEHKNVTLEFEGDAHSPGVTADATQLRQVVMNLVLNAIEATPPGGRIQVSCGRSGGGDGAHVFVRVHDTGPGIAAADLDRVFDPFFTTRWKGSGLELAVTRQIVEAHGGTIDVQSTLGAGTTFVVELPATDGATGAQASEQAPLG